ncbi:hypothetical protein [Desulfoscipio sp. XC116]|uniref:hypothetical protein n=1 Tax=Desulfoscipio sp. XC116 TaxID=3144975 RepID=UPI00325B35B4
MAEISKETERGLDNVHGFINYAIASGVPEVIMWEWIFHTKPKDPVIVEEILATVDNLVIGGQLTVQQIFGIATKSVSNATENEAGDMLDPVREYLKEVIRLWEQGY